MQICDYRNICNAQTQHQRQFQSCFGICNAENRRSRWICDAVSVAHLHYTTDCNLSCVAPKTSGFVLLSSEVLGHGVGTTFLHRIPLHVQTPVEYWFGNSWYEFEPKGVVLVIAPWNYPICLLLDGLITAIASGNCCVLKPTEVAAQSSSFLLRVLPEYVDPEAVLVFEGDASFTQAYPRYNFLDTYRCGFCMTKLARYSIQHDKWHALLAW